MEKNENIQATIIISSYNRFESLSYLLNQFYAQKTKYKFKIIVLDDGSLDEQYTTLKERFSTIIYLKNEENKGLSGYWDSFNTLLNYTKNINSDVVIQLDDDFMLCEDFLDTLLDIYYEINDYYGIIKFHIGMIVNKHKKQHIKSNRGVDGGTLFSVEFLNLIDYHIDDMSKIADGNGSKVWQFLSSKINEYNFKIYAPYKSLVFHTKFDESVMHPACRKKLMYKTLNFIDDE